MPHKNIHVRFCCPLLKRIQLTCTVWVESLNTRSHGRRQTKVLSKTRFSAIAWPPIHGSPCVGVLFITILKATLCAALTTRNTTGHNCIISHAQNTTALHTVVLLTVIHRLLVTNKGRSAFCGANHCQGQLETSQSVSLGTDGVQSVVVWVVNTWRRADVHQRFGGTSKEAACLVDMKVSGTDSFVQSG